MENDELLLFIKYSALAGPGWKHHGPGSAGFVMNGCVKIISDYITDRICLAPLIFVIQMSKGRQNPAKAPYYALLEPLCAFLRMQLEKADKLMICCS